MDNGYLKLWRKLENSKSYSRGAVSRALILTLLVKANWSQGYFHGMEVQPGQIATSIKALSAELNESETTVRRAVNLLQTDGMITVKNVANRFTLITLVNWERYQQGENRSGEPMADQWRAEKNQSETTAQQDVNLLQTEVKKHANKVADQDAPISSENSHGYCEPKITCGEPMADRRWTGGAPPARRWRAGGGPAEPIEEEKKKRNINTSPPEESLVNQDRACAREEPQGRGEASPLPSGMGNGEPPSGQSHEERGSQRAADPVDLSGPGMEFLELRDFYSREIRPEGPLDGFAEYKQLKAARDSTGASVFPGLFQILDDLAARKAAGVWNPGYEISLARYLKTRTWLAPIQARASPQVKSWQEREDEANFNAAMAAARAYDEAKAREKGMVQEKTA